MNIKINSNIAHGKYREEMLRLGAKFFVHRDIGYHVTCKGIWAFDSLPPEHPYNWSRYRKQGDPEGEEGIKLCIDRHYDNRSFFENKLTF